METKVDILRGLFTSPLPLYFPGVISLDNHIYAVGGYDSSCQLRTVERYSPEKCHWEFVADMGSPRSALSVAVINGKLFAIGGSVAVINGKLFAIGGSVAVINGKLFAIGGSVAVINGKLFAIGGSVAVINGKLFAIGGSERILVV